MELEAGIDTTITELITLIANSYDRRRIDLSQVTRYFTLDTLSRLLYSESFGNLKADKDVFQFGDSVATMLPIAELIQNHEWIFKVLTSPVLQKLLNSRAANEIGANKIVALAREHVRERFAKGQRDHKDILVRRVVTTLIVGRANDSSGLFYAQRLIAIAMRGRSGTPDLRWLRLDGNSAAKHDVPANQQSCCVRQVACRSRQRRGNWPHLLSHGEIRGDEETSIHPGLYMGRHENVPTPLRPQDKKGTARG
jgi:hypothetical protein